MNRAFLRVQLTAIDQYGAEHFNRRRTIEMNIPDNLQRSDVDSDGNVDLMAKCLNMLRHEYVIHDDRFIIPLILREVPVSARLVRL